MQTNSSGRLPWFGKPISGVPSSCPGRRLRPINRKRRLHPRQSLVSPAIDRRASTPRGVPNRSSMCMRQRQCDSDRAEMNSNWYQSLILGDRHWPERTRRCTVRRPKAESWVASVSAEFALAWESFRSIQTPFCGFTSCFVNSLLSELLGNCHFEAGRDRRFGYELMKKKDEETKKKEEESDRIVHPTMAIPCNDATRTCVPH